MKCKNCDEECKNKKFEIDNKNIRIKETEKQLYPCVKSFLAKTFKNTEKCDEKQENQKGYGKLDVYVLSENNKKIGAEVKRYFSILGADGEISIGQALLIKKRNDIEKMYVAFPMSNEKEDNPYLINNFPNKYEKILRDLGLENCQRNISILEFNKLIFKKVYCGLGFGLIAIIGTYDKNDKTFKVEEIKEIISPENRCNKELPRGYKN